MNCVESMTGDGFMLLESPSVSDNIRRWELQGWRGVKRCESEGWARGFNTKTKIKQLLHKILR